MSIASVSAARCRAGLRRFSGATAVVIIACSGSTTAATNPGSGSASLGGTVHSTDDGSGIAGVRVVLRGAAGDSIANTYTDVGGAFSFGTRSSGTYRVAAHVPQGYAVPSPSDTTTTVSVATGQTANVALFASPVTTVTLSPRTSAPDTITLAGGTQVVITPTGGLPPASITVGAAPMDSATWYHSPLGVPVETSITPAAAIVGGRGSATISAAFGVDLKLALNQALSTAGQTVQVVAQVPAAAGNWVSSRVNATLTPVTDALTGAVRDVAALHLDFDGAEAVVARYALTAADVTCPEGTAMTSAGGNGSEALVLIHGIQLDKPFCAQYPFFHPESTDFAALIAHLLADPAIASRYHIYAMRYPTFTGVEQAATYLHIQRSLLLASGGKFAIVAHSMGGLVARQYLHDYGAGDIDQVITLATPHLGTTLAGASTATVLTPTIESCYDQHANDFGSGHAAVPWSGVAALGSVAWLYGMSGLDQGLVDLRTTSPLVAAAEPNATLFTTLAGTSAIDAYDHGSSLVNSPLLLAGCFFQATNATPDDEAVPLSSAVPTSWSPAGSMVFARDHLEMTGQSSKGDTDGLLSTITNLLIVSRTAGPQLRLVSGNSQTAPAGTTLPNPLVVQLVTAGGTPIPDAEVEFTPASGAGTVPSSVVVTDGQGRASTTWTVGTAGIENTVATLPGLAAGSVTFAAIVTGGTSCPTLAAYSFGSVVNDALTTASCYLNRPPDTSPYYFRGYAITVPANAAVQIIETSSAFAPRADVTIESTANWSIGFGPSNGSNQVTELALLPAGADVIRAATLNANAVGAFSLSAQLVSANVTNCVNVVIASGVTTTQTLAAGDCTTGGELSDQYLVGIPPGWTADITMSSSVIDTYLALYNGTTFLAADDDGGGGTNSHLRYTSSANIGATLWATSYSGIAQGAYTLSLTLIPPASGSIVAGTAAPSPANPSAGPRPSGRP